MRVHPNIDSLKGILVRTNEHLLGIWGGGRFGVWRSSSSSLQSPCIPKSRVKMWRALGVKLGRVICIAHTNKFYDDVWYTLFLPVYRKLSYTYRPGPSFSIAEELTFICIIIAAMPACAAIAFFDFFFFPSFFGFCIVF